MKAIFLTAATVLICGLSSCNTTIGVGRDMRILGENMERAANNKQQGGGGHEDNSGGGAPVY